MESLCVDTYIFKPKLPIDALPLAVFLESEEHLVEEP